MKKKSKPNLSSPIALVAGILLLMCGYLGWSAYTKHAYPPPRSNLVPANTLEDTTFGFKLLKHPDMHWNVSRDDAVGVEVMVSGDPAKVFSVHAVDEEDQKFGGLALTLSSDDIERYVQSEGSMEEFHVARCKESGIDSAHCDKLRSKTTYREVKAGENTGYHFLTKNIRGDGAPEDPIFSEELYVRLPNGTYVGLYRSGPTADVGAIDLTQWVGYIQEIEVSTGLIVSHEFPEGTYPIYYSDKRTTAALAMVNDEHRLGFRMHLVPGTYYMRAAGEWKKIEVELGRVTVLRESAM